MRAKDYLAYNQEDLMFYDEIKSTLCRFEDSRENLSRTTQYYNKYLSTPEKWEAFIDKCCQHKVTKEKHWTFIQELEKCISEDASYTYLFKCIRKEKGHTKNALEIRDCITNQFENYPKTFIDDYLDIPVNKAFINTIDSRDYSEQQEIDIFNSAYSLFDQIRQQLSKPRHASHIYKEFLSQSEDLKDDILRLLSIYIHDYNYDISHEQRCKLDEIANLLGTYIQRRNNQNEKKTLKQGKWQLLKETIDNMIGNKEKIALLLQEKATYLQLPEEERKVIGIQFADNCQIEIDKIKAIQALEVNEEEPETNDEKSASIKTSSIIIMEMLKLLNKGKSVNDMSTICRLIAFLTGKSYSKIYNEVQKGICLSNYHSKEIEQANKILSDLNTNISINKDKQY